MSEEAKSQEHPVKEDNKRDVQREVHPIFAPILDAIKGVQVRNATKEKQE